MVFFYMAAALAPNAPVAAQDTPTEQEGPRPATPAQAGPNSPSEATATVSPVTAAEAVTDTDATHSVAFSFGTSIATGHFGTSSRSTLWSTALGARLDLGSLRLSASIPYMRVRSNGVIFTGIDSTPVVIAGGAGHKRTNEGWGDVTLGTSYTLRHDPGAVEIEFAGRGKLATASSGSRLSSGKTDYSFGIQATKVVGSVAPFVSATYRVLGDTRSFDLRDGFAASAGASLVLDSRTVVLGSYHYARAASRLLRDSQELFLGGSRELAGDRLRLTGFSTVGLSSGAAALSGGLALSLSL